MRSGQIGELRAFSRYADRNVIADGTVQFASGQCCITGVDDVVRQRASAAIHVRNADGICFDSEIRRARSSRHIHVQSIIRENPAQRGITGRIIFRRIRHELIATYRIEAIENGEIAGNFSAEGRPLRRIARFVVGILRQTRLVRISFERIVRRRIDRWSTHTINLLPKRRHHGH